MEREQNRLASINVIIRDRNSSQKVNDILSAHGDCIRGRLGLPYPERGLSVIVILVDADNAKIGAITGAIGNLPGVSLRSVMLV